MKFLLFFLLPILVFGQNEKLPLKEIAPDFSQPGINWNLVSLSSFRGKYVLIDFWASWCSPCRAENPNLLKAYHKFKDKNFTVLAVSLDNQKRAWLDAIEKDGLPWTHVSDLQGWDNAVAKLYNVKFAPMNFLVDPKGLIIAKNLRGDELEETLSRFLESEDKKR